MLFRGPGLIIQINYLLRVCFFGIYYIHGINIFQTLISATWIVKNLIFYKLKQTYPNRDRWEWRVWCNQRMEQAYLKSPSSSFMRCGICLDGFCITHILRSFSLQCSKCPMEISLDTIAPETNRKTFEDGTLSLLISKIFLFT